MTSRCVKPVLALLAVLAASLAFAAPPAGLNWEVHGTGSGTVDTVPVSGVVLSVSSDGPAMPQHVGNATYSLRLSGAGTNGGNGDVGGICEFISGFGSITAADGSTINFNTVGLICNEAGSNSPYHYNGTYRITGGGGRFDGPDFGGGGSLTATFGPRHFIKIDGTITGL
jgi:hypothetical protein